MSDQATPLSDLNGLNRPGVYFCRGCGTPLPEGSKARFHAECRRADKRRRVAERRERQSTRENRIVHKNLRRLNCPDCGVSLAKLLHADPRRVVNVSCATSQGTVDRLKSEERRR